MIILLSLALCMASLYENYIGKTNQQHFSYGISVKKQRLRDAVELRFIHEMRGDFELTTNVGPEQLLVGCVLYSLFSAATLKRIELKSNER